MELISSPLEEVSARAAACSEAPCARDWIEDDIWLAALATCPAPSLSSMTVCRKTRLMLLTMKNAKPEPQRIARRETLQFHDFAITASLAVASAIVVAEVRLYSTSLSTRSCVSSKRGIVSALYF